jgi:nucleoside-diphosphate-sugar epimerase
MRFRWLQLARLVRARRMLVFNGGQAPLPLIHVDDLVRAVMHAVEAVPSAGYIDKVIIASGEDTRIGDVIDFMSDYYGVAPCRRVPAWPFHSLAALVQLCPNALKTERMRLVNRDSVTMYSVGYRFDTEKARLRLGFESRTPFTLGMKDMLDSFGDLS